MNPPRPPRPLLLGHRGARANKAIPENTIASFDRALADGCDGFEFDVRLTSDGEAVVCHDPEYAEAEIAHSPAKLLEALPRLEDILARYHGRAFLDIELKVAGLEKIIVDLSLKYPPKGGFVVSSFLPEVLDAVHELDPALPLGLICETPAQLRAWSRLPIAYVIPHHSLVDSAFVKRCKQAGKKILVWTVNSAADMRRLGGYGVDGIISDDASLLCRTLRS